MPSLNTAQQQELQKAAHARLRREFAKRTFDIANYRPPTGIGLFDFKYLPATRRIEVRVKGAYNFLGPADNAAYLTWTELEKSDYKAKAAKVISDAWSGKYRIVCKDPQWSDLSAAVDIQLVEAPRTNAHYIIDARKVTQSETTAWAGGCSHGAGTWPYTANFSNWGVETRIDLFGDQVFNLKEKQLVERLQAHKLAFIPMAHGSAALSPDARDRLFKFVREAKQILGSDVTGIQCNVFGCSTEKLGSSRAREREEAVAKLLKGELPHFFATDRSTTAKTQAKKVAQALGKRLDDLSGVLLYIHVPPHSLRRVYTNYIIITHEFGHMLGCPDEYQGVNCTGIKELMRLDQLVPSVLRKGAIANVTPLAPGDHFSKEKATSAAGANVARLQQQQTAFASQIQQAGVQSPTFFPQGADLNDPLETKAISDKYYKDRAAMKAKLGEDHPTYAKFRDAGVPVTPVIAASDSIMFTGQKILSAHYLPIWSALATATREFVDPSDWAIERV